MIFIAVTGGIGSGKSSVAQWLCRESGLMYINADQVARELFAPDSCALNILKEVVGDDFFDEEGALKRAELRKAIFADEELRRRIDNFSHPFIWQEIERRALEDSASRKGVVFVEVPLLFEAGWYKLFNYIIVVYADPQSCLERLMRRDMIDRKEAVSAMKAQQSLAEKTMLADHVIDNSGTWFDTLLQIKRLSRILRQRFTIQAL